MINPGFIYFLHAEGTDRYKIGLTNDIDRRLRELNGKQAAFAVKLLWSIEVADMRSAESWLHEKFSDRRVHGEWFRFDTNELSRVRELYIDAGEQFNPRQTQSSTHSAPNPEFEFPWGWIFGGLGLLGLIGFAIIHAPTQSAIVTQFSNIRETPNGKVICTVPKGKQITIEISDSQWLKTPDACDRPGLIYRGLVREVAR